MKIDEIDINCAEHAEVTAIYVTTSIAIAPDVPFKATAAAGATNPASCCAMLRGWGYVGNAGLFCRARAERPMMVPKAKGTENQERPPRRYALVVPCGWDAMARCQ